ncbi:aromatic-ring-hydroxylating dioxygenase subunit beta [Pigmentiphaga sp.]|uniref:aromatic-ring-hydroxylating dioxygenase subunit beta n=1 Tax=Pigmentiphaga sp. TaxID=1977564 RepID=UPI0025D000B0|nr:aromatic-ring-hydroxylating dioxygenase subunit beta [Pigmentiphaga sp.]
MLQDISQFVFREAKLLDDKQYEAWLALFDDDGLYVVPLTEEPRPGRQADIVNDNKAAREERVHHLMHHWFPAQQPPSRTRHFVSNVMAEERDGLWRVSTSQLIYETRAGDWFQVGLGEVRPIVAGVDYALREVERGFRICEKRIRLLDMAGWQANLAFIY